MRHIDLDALPPDVNDWLATWQEKANTATRKIITIWEEKGTVTSADFDSGLWSELKNYLLDNVFDGKCAYCETNVLQARQYGDADHFRPKGAVTFRERPERESKRVEARTEDHSGPAGRVVSHPGYFWLAYNWKNLLPACEKCNSGRGKQDQFPIRAVQHIFNFRQSEQLLDNLGAEGLQSVKDPDLYYPLPEVLDGMEQPLLLHPYFGDNPTDDLEFDYLGEVRARVIGDKASEVGLHSIVAYDLQDRHLSEARHDAQLAAESLFTMAVLFFKAIRELPPIDAKNAAMQEPKIKRILDGHVPYSIAILDYYKLNGYVT